VTEGEELAHHLAAAIGTIGPGRNKQMHMIMGIGISETKAHRNTVKKGRKGSWHMLLGKIVPYGKDYFIDANFHCVIAQQWLLGAPMSVGTQHF
jgi:hypothetical protein